MDSDQEEGQDRLMPGGQRSFGPSPDKVLEELEAAFSKEHAELLQSHIAERNVSNPLLTRLNQNSAELAKLAAVGHQLGPDGARVPPVIGDFVGLSSTRTTTSTTAVWTGVSDLGEASSSSTGLERHEEVLRNIRLEDDEEEVNELDTELDNDDNVDEDDEITLNFTETLQRAEHDLGRLDEAMRRENATLSSALDSQRFMGMEGEGSSWDSLSGLGTGDPDDEEFDENDPAIEELGFALTPKSKKEKKKLHKKGTIVLSPEVQRLLGLANNAYVNKNYSEAVDLFQQVIVKDARVFQAWNIMGVIQEELGNMDKALQLYLVAAHLTPKDGTLWKKLAGISRELGYNQQALYCYSKACAADRTDLDALWDRSMMQSMMDQPEKAIRGFLTILTIRPHYMAALEELVKLYSSLNQDHKKYNENMHKAMELYEAAYFHYSSLPDRFSTESEDPFEAAASTGVELDRGESEPFGYSAMNMLSELYIMFEEYEKPLQMIKTWSRRLQRRSHQVWWNDYKDDREFDADSDDEDIQASLGENRTRGLPVDLRVKLGVCRLMLEQVREAKAQFKYLWKCSVEDFPDLYEEIAELYISKQMWKEAYNVIRAILQYDELDVPKIWTMAGDCLRHMHQHKEAKDYLEQAHRAEPSNVDVSMMLAEVYEEMGNLPQALNLVNYVRQLNSERLAEAERKRREARVARDTKTNKDGPSSGAASIPSYPLDPNYPEARYRQIAPRPGESVVSGPTSLAQAQAYREAVERINLASRDNTAAEQYSAADRDRDIQLVKSFRERERADMAVERDYSLYSQQNVTEKFNRLEEIYRHINQKEKSRRWRTKREAVHFTREDRTQYIQVARELVNVFRSNKAFFGKEKSKPYMGAESRSWRYRRLASEFDNGLSEHAADMAERIGRAMGIQKETIQSDEVIGLPPGVTPPTTYRGVPFDSWYLMMIRQAVYLTYEDRYTEAAELLMKMFNANVFYTVPRRRSGIMFVLLACAIWATDYDAIVNAGRWLCNFGGIRPFALRVFQSAFTLGPRGHTKFFTWVNSATQKYLKRQVDMMRTACGNKNSLLTRRRPRFRKPRVDNGRRGPRKKFSGLTPTLAAASKRFKTDHPSSSPWPETATPVTKSSGNSSKVANFPWKGTSSYKASSQTSMDAYLDPNTNREKASASDAREDSSTGFESSSLRSGMEKRLSKDNIVTGKQLGDKESPEGNSLTERERSLRQRLESGAFEPLHRKRRAMDESEDNDEEEEGEEEEENIENENDDENDMDDDDTDPDDETYKEDSKDQSSDDDDIGGSDWEDEAEFPRAGISRFRKGGVGPLRDEDGDDEDDDGDEDEEEENNSPLSGRKGTARRPKETGSRRSTRRRVETTREQYARIHPEVIQGEFGEERTRLPSRGLKTFTRPSYSKYYINLVMFYGHMLAFSRSHSGAAAQYAECMKHCPDNPMIRLYLAVQLINMAMQRTTENRQLALAQALAVFQSYYHLRREGRGSIAFAEREKQLKASSRGNLPTSSETENDKSASSETAVVNDSEEATSASEQAVSEPPSNSAAKEHPPVSNQPSLSKDPADSLDVTPDATPSDSSKVTSAPLSETDLPPLNQCLQEAEFNYARGFHQLGQNHLAMIHYKRVLELPSWRQVEKEHRALARKRVREQREARREARRTERAQKKAEKQKAREQLSSSEEKGEAETATEGNQEKTLGDSDDSQAEKEMAAESENEEEEEDDDEEDEDDVEEEKEEDEEDPTDLKREAAFNLAKIYLQSGAVGQAQLLMHKYCTI